MPKGGPCDHGRCPPGDCRMLTDDELRPDEKDIEFAKKLVAEGWQSTSNKYRMVCKLAVDPPAEEILAPEYRNTWTGKKMMEFWDKMKYWELRGNDEPNVRKLELTVKQFQAFKKLTRLW